MSSTICLDVSRETQDRLEKYQALLAKWQTRINLVAPDTLADSWNRHFVDSLQIIKFLPPEEFTLIDMGTGAGFPGLVIAITRPNSRVHLIESDSKKCEFLKAVSRETSASIQIHNSRIEATPPFMADIITARALASLTELLGYTLPFAALNPHVKMIYLKGARWESEINDAQNTYMFDVETHESLTSNQSRVLIISNLKRK